MTIDDVFTTAGQQELILRRVDELIRQTAPSLSRSLADTMAGKPMIGYGKYHYKYPSGREGDWWTIALAAQKNYTSLYVCAMVGDQYMAEVYGDKLGKVAIGRSCIRFKKFEDLHIEQVQNIIREAAEWFKNQLPAQS